MLHRQEYQILRFLVVTGVEQAQMRDPRFCGRSVKPVTSTSVLPFSKLHEMFFWII